MVVNFPSAAGDCELPGHKDRGIAESLLSPIFFVFLGFEKIWRRKIRESNFPCSSIISSNIITMND